MSSEERVTIITLSNSSVREKALQLEPWGEVFAFPSNARLEIAFTGPLGVPEIDVDDEAITVWGWSGTTVGVKSDGVELRAPGGSPVPPVPTSFGSLQQFIQSLFGS